MENDKVLAESELFCYKLPKLDLHAHLNGSISVSTLDEIRQKNLTKGYEQVGENKWQEWKNLLNHEGDTTLDKCFEMFDMAHSVTKHPSAIQLATERVIHDFAEDNVMYLELRSTLRQEQNMTKKQYLDSMIQGVLNARTKDPSIMVKLLISVNRGESIQSGAENIALAIEAARTHPDIVVGVDLSGNPSKGKFADFRGMFDAARKAGLKVALHCAEVEAEKEVLEIVEFGPDRLGHCTCVHTALSGTEATWKAVTESKIPVELCITSNVTCKTVACPEEHQLRYFYNSGHPITIATDDKGVFGTTTTKEVFKALKACKLTTYDIWLITINSVDYTFAASEDKIKLKKTLNLWQNQNLFITRSN